MRILYHHRTASRDGQEVHIRELIGALRALGHPVEVVGPGGDPAAASSKMGGRRSGVSRFRALVPDALMPIASRVWSLFASNALANAARSFHPDVLYERHALDNRAGVVAAKALGIPLLLEVNAPLAREQHEQGDTGSLEPSLARESDVMRRADAILAVTRVLAEILISDGVPAERIHVIHNGASRRLIEAPRDPSRRSRFAGDGAVVLGFIGFPRKWHALERVLVAMAEAGSGAAGGLGRAVFCVAGEGPAVDSLRREAERLGVVDRVRFEGVLGRDDVVPFLDSIDVGLQPAATRYASPLKLFEYLARGVPVLAPRQPNIEEIVEDGRSALLFDPADPQDFARGLDRLVADADLRRRIGAGGKERIVTGGFTWEDNARRVVAIATRCATVRGNRR